MENLEEGGSVLHGKWGRCGFVEGRKCGPGCHFFLEKEGCCIFRLIAEDLERIRNEIGFIGQVLDYKP